MNYIQSRAKDSQENVETQVMITCKATITIVHEAVRTVQTAALDIRDAVAELQRLHARIQAEALQPEAAQALQSAVEQGLALVRSFDAMGIYAPVPIELF